MPDIDDGKSERASTSKSLKSDINESEQLVTLICTENVQVSEKDISNENEKSHEDKELTDVAADITKEALSDSYFQCIGKLKFAAEKINSSGGSWYFSLGGQVFEKLGVVENMLGSHTQKNDIG